MSANNSSENLDLISDELIKILELSLTIPLHGSTSAVGLVTNFLCMVILFKLGLTNSMNILVFVLSMTDFLVTTLQLSICLCFLLKYLYPDCEVDLWVMGFYTLGWVRYAGFFISCWVTTFISVERCLCVVFPFNVGMIVTKTRTVVVVVLIYIAFLGLVTPIYIQQKLDWELQYTMGTNGTLFEKWVLTVSFTEQSASLEIIVDTVGAVSLSLLSQLILTFCTVWMISALKTSSKIRKVNSGGITLNQLSGAPIQEEKETGLTSKERRLLRMVICLALILTACNVPRYAEIAAYHLIPGMNVGKYKNLSGFLWDLSDFFSTLNCSCNFIVYWKLNSKFRKCFKDMSCRRRLNNNTAYS
ncbi:muscarinic acetylcholine receptor M4 [Biomphalaria glabrata]|uniref:Uncharacterized protein LOC129928403 n=1 Tax=Biomphalaria glabrata TaxID=6526 RepID=A0A9W3BGM6_BIOGL|nr:uncharacterized protein LOC129928403 [Biomphalaria glabrata]